MKYNSTLPLSLLFLAFSLPSSSSPLTHTYLWLTTKVWIREVPCNPSFITKSVPDWIGGMRSRKCQWSCLSKYIVQCPTHLLHSYTIQFSLMVGSFYCDWLLEFRWKFHCPTTYFLKDRQTSSCFLLLFKVVPSNFIVSSDFQFWRKV